MGAQTAGWWPVGDGRQRYWDGTAWTDNYKAIGNMPAAGGSTAPAPSLVPPQPVADQRTARRRPLWSPIILVLLAGMAVLTVTRVATTLGPAAETGNLTATHLPATKTNRPPAPKAKTPAKPHTAPSHHPAAAALQPAKPKPVARPTSAAPKPVVTQAAPQPPAWDGHGYTEKDYAERVGDIPVWVGKVRDASAAGYIMTVHTDLSGLSNRFDEIGRLPAPPRVDPAWWAAMTSTLTQFSQQAADEWAQGDSLDAMARFEVIVKNSNTLIQKANAAFGLHIKLSPSAA